LAEKLFAVAGRDLEEVQQSIDDNLRPFSFELTSRAHLRVDLTRARAEVQNVLGYLPPSDVSGEEELIVIGGHYDHVGLGRRHSRSTPENKGQIHNGADDNASGIAGVIELARVFSTRTDLERGILFAAFAGEELGLLGSSHYTRNPTLPLDKTVAMINMDMIGRLRKDKLFIGGVGTSPVFRVKLDELGKAENLDISYSFSGYGSSDHTSFTLKEVPSLFFFTGLHGDYHKPSDDWQEINAAGAERVLRVAYQIADYVQGLGERPAFTRPAMKESKTRGGGGGRGAWFCSTVEVLRDGKTIEAKVTLGKRR
jgi:Zn-dependent M28 family amino/carboxypeptidase